MLVGGGRGVVHQGFTAGGGGSLVGGETGIERTV